MKAQFQNLEARNGKNYGDTKETVNTMTVICRNAKTAPYRAGELTEAVIARFYMGRSRTASTVYCSVWVHANGVCVAGHGSAGGWGYHKQSAALASALRSAEITLTGSPYDGENENSEAEADKPASISGCGDSAMRSALLAVARATGADCSEYLIV